MAARPTADVESSTISLPALVELLLILQPEFRRRSTLAGMLAHWLINELEESLGYAGRPDGD